MERGIYQAIIPQTEVYLITDICNKHLEETFVDPMITICYIPPSQRIRNRCNTLMTPDIGTSFRPDNFGMPICEI